MGRDTIWMVSEHSPEYVSGGAGPYIPTEGCPASAVDLFRVKGIYSSNFKKVNGCFVDPHVCDGLGRILCGGVTHWDDIVKFELALQAVLFHDHVDFLYPTIKVRQSGFVGYHRFPIERQPIVYDFFRPVDAWDSLYAAEEVYSEGGVVVRSTRPNSRLIFSDMSKFDYEISDYIRPNDLMAPEIFSAPFEFGHPAYYYHPVYRQGPRVISFVNRFHHIVNKEWYERSLSIPRMNFYVHIPPLASIVLDRCSSRGDMIAEIAALREELSPVRAELGRFKEKFSLSAYQAEIEDSCKYIEESFRAIVRASKVKPWRWGLYRIASVGGSLLNIFDHVRRYFNPEYVPQDASRLANRTITGKMFTKMLHVESLMTLLHRHFSPSELSAIARTYTPPPDGAEK